MPEQPNTPDNAKHSNTSANANTGAADPLLGRLDSYLTDLDREPVPAPLACTTLVDLQGSHRIGPEWNTPGLAFLGAAAAIVLILGFYVATRNGGGPEQLGTHAGEPAAAGPGMKLPAPPTTVGGSAPSVTDQNDLSTNTSVAPTITADSNSTTTTPSNSTTILQPGASELIFDDFSSGPGRWTIDSGAMSVWNSAEGNFLANDSALGTSRASAGSTRWANYTVSATLKMDTGAIGAGLSSRYQDVDNYVFCKIDLQDGHLWLGVNRNGSERLLANSKFTFIPATLYNMTLSASGNAFDCSVAGATSATGADATFAAGKIAVLAEGHAGFTNVKVIGN